MESAVLEVTDVSEIFMRVKYQQNCTWALRCLYCTLASTNVGCWLFSYVLGSHFLNYVLWILQRRIYSIFVMHFIFYGHDLEMLT
jgi:hypothetical protein